VLEQYHVAMPIYKYTLACLNSQPIFVEIKGLVLSSKLATDVNRKYKNELDVKL